MSPPPVDAAYDIVVVGAGIARDAAGRGFRVLLVEQDDLASHTSSASTKLIHGGLRYLELYDFALVRKALLEREVLLAAAPHIIWPMRFVMPHDAHLRPAWMIRAGLFLYDHLARRQRLAGSRTIDLRTHPAGPPLESQYRRGFEYSDAWVDDSRLVVLNAVDAREHGAAIHTRTRCAAILRGPDAWELTLVATDGHEPSARVVTASALVNATGPWVSEFLRGIGGVRARHRVRLVKGSHIVVPKLFAHSYAYIFQTTDQRIVFAIPYEGQFTLIGTTDIDYHGDAGSPAIDDAERRYLLEMANRYFARDLTEREIAWSYSGVRPLVDDDAADARSVTRDYTLDLDAGGPPLLSVYGGKITTFRRLAEEAVDRLGELLGGGTGAWTAAASLPGGDMPHADFAAFLRGFLRRHPWLPERLAQRYARAYGTRAERILGSARSARDLGAEVLPGLYEAEIEHLRREEWAVTSEDILLRRTKLGLHVAEGGTAVLDAWLAGRASP
jgi:glycerol-3-phosphate dehydrogenase